MEKSWDVGLMSVPHKDSGLPESAKAFRRRSQWASAEMTSPVSGLKETRLSQGTRLEKFMKRKTRTHKTSLQGIATRAARLPVFAVSLATLRFGLFANWWACCPNRA